jgi:hypothetical protein
MLLPGAGRAVVDIAKLRYYCLSPTHPRGRHKARVFAATVGLTAADAEALREALLVAARTREAIAGKADEYGQRYAVDLDFVRAGRRARIRSAWIVLTGESFPRFTSCHVLLD